MLCLLTILDFLLNNQYIINGVVDETEVWYAALSSS